MVSKLNTEALIMYDAHILAYWTMQQLAIQAEGIALLNSSDCPF